MAPQPAPPMSTASQTMAHPDRAKLVARRLTTRPYASAQLSAMPMSTSSGTLTPSGGTTYTLTKSSIRYEAQPPATEPKSESR